jgi:hypothetical protein
MTSISRRDSVVRVAGLFWSIVLPRIGAAAITMPTQRIYVLREHVADKALLIHELTHIRQMRREGSLRFAVKYLWFLIAFGYWDNPYEIEAFARDGRGMRKT